MFRNIVNITRSIKENKNKEVPKIIEKNVSEVLEQVLVELMMISLLKERKQRKYQDTMRNLPRKVKS